MLLDVGQGIVTEWYPGWVCITMAFRLALPGKIPFNKQFGIDQPNNYKLGGHFSLVVVVVVVCHVLQQLCLFKEK